MIKNFLFVAALLSLALASGCATGGSGPGGGPTVTVTGSANGVDGVTVAALGFQISLTTKVVGTDKTAVNWTITGDSCTGDPNPCGSFVSTTSTSAVYQAPATVPSTPQIVIKATLQADSNIVGTLPLTIAPITTDVAPTPVNLGQGLVQQFTAVAVPDYVHQTFTWTCTAAGVPCANFVQDSSVSGLATYTAQDHCSNACIQISAAATDNPTGCTLDPKDCTAVKGTLVPARLSGTYAFQFSGYDTSNHAVSVAGTFTVAGNGSISGIEDELTSGGPAQHTVTGGSYTPGSSDPNTNNAGTLRLTTGTFPDQFQVTLDAKGDVMMIESDGHGTGSGQAVLSGAANLFSGDQTFAFGFTGVDSGGNRAGYVGLLPMDGSGHIAGGQMDVNDNGNTTNICGAAPCNLGGSYATDGCNCGLYHMTVTSAVTMHFDFYLASGTAKATAPLTFYAISVDPVDSTHPGVSGTMVVQDSSQTYNNAAFNGTSVSALTGANANVSLTMGDTDKNGNFSGNFDQNNGGTIVSVADFGYKYAAVGTSGRYTFEMLGNPGASPVVPPVPFVLYASGGNRGFLLDQSSPSVMTGTMNPQGKGGGFFAGSVLPSTFGAATVNSGSATGISPVAANLLATSPGNQVFNFTGTQYPGPQTLTGTYTLDFTGTGKVVLTAPSAQNYVIYVRDTSGCTGQSLACSVESFYMMDVDKTNPNASIVFAQQ